MRTAGVLGGIVLAVLALLLSACSDPRPDEAAKPSSEQPVITGTPPDFSDADVAFADSTIRHHRLSMEAAKLAPGRSDDPNLVALAADIGVVQQSEFEVAKVFLTQWSFDSEDAGIDPGAAYGPVNDPTIDRLASLSGPEFDTLWLQTMAEYHRKAISIADAEIADGSNADAVTQATQMQESQRAQLEQLEQMLADR